MHLHMLVYAGKGLEAAKLYQVICSYIRVYAEMDFNISDSMYCIPAYPHIYPWSTLRALKVKLQQSVFSGVTN